MKSENKWSHYQYPSRTFTSIDLGKFSFWNKYYLWCTFSKEYFINSISIKKIRFLFPCFRETFNLTIIITFQFLLMWKLTNHYKICKKRYNAIKIYQRVECNKKAQKCSEKMNIYKYCNKKRIYINYSRSKNEMKWNNYRKPVPFPYKYRSVDQII